MSLTERCRLCSDFHDTLEHPELLGVCQNCWHIVQDWLTERGITLVTQPTVTPMALTPGPPAAGKEE